MAKGIHRLTALQIEKAKKPGRIADGGGLYLQVTVGSDDRIRRSWLVRYRLNGKTREMGLGPLEIMDLGDARDAAKQARKRAGQQIDPIEARESERAQAAQASAPKLTFKQAAEKFIDTHESGWSNPKHRQQWRNTLDTYAYPAFGSKPITEVTRADIIGVLDPIWKEKTETASRVMNRCVRVLEWSVARGYRTGEEVAAWPKLIQRALPPRSKIQKVEHHPALPYADMKHFMAQLSERSTTTARALEFLILTASRTTETLQARWTEIDLKAAVWTVPGERMKNRRPHRVPLSKKAVSILKDVKRLRSKEWVFPGLRGHLSETSLLTVLEGMGRDDITVHGFRSTFRDWAAERTSFPREVAEKALAHVVKDKAEAAYQRGDMLDKRRVMMEDWAKFCSPTRADQRRK